jgi:hypothetical protein
LLEGIPELEDIEETDLVLAIWRSAFDDSPTDISAGDWLLAQFHRMGADELYDRYLVLCDEINGTDFAESLRS